MRSNGQQAITIAGAGLSGLTLAVALKQALGGVLEVVVCDPAIKSARVSGRASALAAGPRKMFEALGIWSNAEAMAQPIHSMIITDSRREDSVRPSYLQFGGEAETGAPLAHMVEDDDVFGLLTAMALQLDVHFIASAISDTAVSDGSVSVTLQDGRTRPSQLLVAADGGSSRLRSKMRIATTGWDYRQSGIVATLAHENPHEGQAEEHFLPQGPFAVLPLRGNRISIVWTQLSKDAAAAIALPETEFVAQVAGLAGPRLGEFTLAGRPRAFPLALRLARSLTAPRFALLGDAAHVIHPIAGQGLNLGLRDAAVLAEAIAGQVQLGLDIGAPDMLEGYQRARRFDSFTMAATTDGLNRLFASDFLPLRMARDFGLGIVNRLPGVKKMLIGEAGGSAGQTSRLLQGIWP